MSTEITKLKALSPLQITKKYFRQEGEKLFISAALFREIGKNSLIYEAIKRDKDLFNLFYKKLLAWRNIYLEKKKEYEKNEKKFKEELQKHLKAVAIWLEKTVLCGGMPEIVEYEVVNYDEKKNVLNAVVISDFEMIEGNISEKKVKIVGERKKVLGLRKLVERESIFEGKLQIDEENFKALEEISDSPALQILKEKDIENLINHFSIKQMERDKEILVDRGYSDIVKLLEDIEADSEGKLVKINYREGLLPLGAELWIYELIEKGKGRKEFHYLNEIMQLISTVDGLGDIFTNERKITIDRKPIGWAKLT
jgi:predicted MPP superfamily phosphohydrolase